MKLRKSLKALLSLTAAAMLLFTGCAGNADTKKEDSASEKSSEAVEESSEAAEESSETESSGSTEPLVVECYSMKRDTYPEAVAKFEAFLKENLDFAVEFTNVSGKYAEQLNKYTTMLASGDTSTDVYYLDEIMIKSFSEADFLAPVEDVITDDVLADFLPGYADMFLKKDGHTYGVPATFEAFVCFANKALFKEAGIDVPTNKEEFIEAAEAMQKIGKKLLIECWNKDSHLQDCLNKWCLMFGGNYYDWESEETLEAVQFMHDMIYKYGACSVDDISNDWNTGAQKFIDGEAAMYFQWDGVAGKFDAAGVYGDDQIVMVPMPTFATNHTISSSWIWTVNKNSTKIDMAKEFLKLMATPEAQNLYNAARGGATVKAANPKAWEDPTFKENPITMVEEFETYLDEGCFVPRTISARHSEFMNTVTGTLQEYLMDTITYEECVELAREEIAKLNE